MRPAGARKTVCDPACGTGGFFLAAYDFITDPEHYQLNRTQKQALKTKPLTFDDLSDFIACYNPGERHKRHETWSEKNPEGRWRKYDYADLIARDKTSLDIFWLKDKSLSDLDNLPDPEELAADIITNLQAALANFQEVAGVLEE